MKFLPPSQYQDRNRKLFDLYRARILEKLSFARVEHIGASAMPGAYSKGDLDIFVGVPVEAIEPSVDALASLGFEVKRDTLRTPELCMLVLPDNDPDIAVQLVANESRFESFITFRDALVRSQDLLTRYNALKLECSGMDQESYRERKAAFIEAVVDPDWCLTLRG